MSVSAQAIPSGWYFYNESGQATLAVVPESGSYYSVRILLDHDPGGNWSELNWYATMEDALAFALEEAAR